MNTKELIDRIFKEPGVKFELTEFENLGKPIHDIITIFPKMATTGKDAGKDGVHRGVGEDITASQSDLVIFLKVMSRVMPASRRPPDRGRSRRRADFAPARSVRPCPEWSFVWPRTARS